MVTLQETQAWALKNGSYLMLLFVVGFYFSTVLTSIISILLGALWLFTKQYKHLIDLLKTQSIACWSLLLFTCFLLGLSYGNTAESDAFYSLGKYKKFVFIPILMIFFYDPRYRRWAWRGFVIASILTLLFSDLKAAGLLNLNPHYVSATIKNRITHSIFVAFFAFYCLHKMYGGSAYAKLYLVLCVLSLHNLFFVVDGRTGQVIALVLIGLLAFQRLSRKGFFLSLVILSVFMGLFLNFSDKAKRINEGIINSEKYLEHTLDPALRETSVAARYVFWDYSSKLIAEKPMFGHGTGSFVQEYNRIAKGDSKALLHAHNEFIMIGVQLGLLGIIVYLGFLGSQFYSAKQLLIEDKLLAQGFLLTLLITSMFNCPIYDHAQGHWAITLIALCFAPLQDYNKQENYA
jgi:O-antigen ligase